MLTTRADRTTSWLDTSVDTAGVVHRFRRRWYVMAIGALAGAAAALLLARLVTPLFAASATIRVVSAPADAAQVTKDFATLQVLLQRTEVAARLVQSHGLTNPPHQLTAERLVGERLSIQPVRDAGLIHVALQLADPGLAATVLNELVADATDAARRTTDSDATARRDMLKKQRDEAAERFRVAEADLLAFRQAAHLELSEADVRVAVRQRERAQDLQALIARERAHLATAERERESRPQTRPAAGDAEPNRVWDELDRLAAGSRALIDGLERERAEIVRIWGARGAELPVLSQLQERRVELARRERDFSVKGRVLDELSVAYEQAVVRTPQPRVDVLAAATAPEAPATPQRAWWVTTGFSLGLLGGALLTQLGRRTEPSL